jgi:hypothetical protein
MSYLNFSEDYISLTEEECFLVEDASDYILSLTDEELDLLETTDIEYIMDFLEAVGAGYDNRFTNMFINHRQRDSYSHLMPGFRNSSPIYRASDQYQKHSMNANHPAIKQLADKKESLTKLINLSKKKLGKNHPYVKAKKKEYRKLKRDIMNAMNGKPDRLSERISLGKGTRKAIRKRYDLVNVPKNDDVLTDKEKKQVPQFGEDSKRGNPIDFEAHHKKMNKRAMQAKDRLERYLNGERKHLQRDKDGNVIKGKNGKAKVFYDKYDRDEKTGKIVGKAHEYSDEEYVGNLYTYEVNDINDVSTTKNVAVILNKNSVVEKNMFTIKNDVYKANFSYNLRNKYNYENVDFINTFTVNLLRKVISSNADEVLNDGKTLVWNIKNGESKAINFKFSFKDENSHIYLGFIIFDVVLVLGLGAFYYIRKFR